MHAVLHRPPVLVLLMRSRARAAVLALDRMLVLERLPDFQVDFVAVHHVLCDSEDIRDESIEKVEGHAFAHDHAQDLGAVFFGWEGVVCWVGC